MNVVINGVIYVPRSTSSIKGLYTFPVLMKKIREDNNYTLDDAAKYIGCSKSYLWGMENGRHEPSLRMGMQICEAYGMDVERLIESLLVGE